LKILPLSLQANPTITHQPHSPPDLERPALNFCVRGAAPKLRILIFVRNFSPSLFPSPFWFEIFSSNTSLGLLSTFSRIYNPLPFWPSTVDPPLASFWLRYCKLSVFFIPLSLYVTDIPAHPSEFKRKPPPLSLVFSRCPGLSLFFTLPLSLANSFCPPFCLFYGAHLLSISLRRGQHASALSPFGVNLPCGEFHVVVSFRPFLVSMVWLFYRLFYSPGLVLLHLDESFFWCGTPSPPMLTFTSLPFPEGY